MTLPGGLRLTREPLPPPAGCTRIDARLPAPTGMRIVEYRVREVGTQGFGPRATRVSGEPRRPAGEAFQEHAFHRVVAGENVGRGGPRAQLTAREPPAERPERRGRLTAAGAGARVAAWTHRPPPPPPPG